MKKIEYYNLANIDAQAKLFVDKLEIQRKAHKNQTILPKNIALLVIDMQNFFYDINYHAYVPSILAIMPKVKALQEYFFQHNMPVFHTQHGNTLSNSKQMLNWWGSINEESSSHANIINEIQNPLAKVIKKTQYDAFWETNLAELFQAQNIKQLIITGVMTHLCCETTARSAFVRGLEVFFTVDGTATYNPTFHFGTLYNLAHGFALPVLVEEIFYGLNNPHGMCF